MIAYCSGDTFVFRKTEQKDRQITWLSLNKSTRQGRPEWIYYQELDTEGTVWREPPNNVIYVIISQFEETSPVICLAMMGTKLVRVAFHF